MTDAQAKRIIDQVAKQRPRRVPAVRAKPPRPWTKLDVALFKMRRERE